jgi:two-component system sensor histidine kinase/response regulator
MLQNFFYRLLPRRFDRQVMLLVTLSLGLIIPVFALYEAGENSKRIVDSATLQARALAENIAVTSVEYIITENFTSTEQLLLRSARFPGVVAIQAADADDRVVADVILGPDGKPALRYDLNLLRPPAATTSQLENKNGLLIIWQPVIGANVVGWIKLTYSLDEAERIARNYLQDHLIDGLIMTALLVALLLLVMRRPLRLLRDAADFAGQLKEKNGAQMPAVKGSIEIEQLNQALNDASTELHEHEIAIKKAMKDLNTQKSAMDEHSIVSITDTEGRITYANQKFLDLTGFTNGELLGKKHNLINSGFHSDAFFHDLWETISAGRVWHGEILNKSKHGRELWMNTTIVPFMSEPGNPYEYVAISTDVTEQKQVEQELAQKAESLKQMTDHLEELVKQRTADLEEANIQLQHMNKIKSEFVSVVSHELRTPLTSIKSFTEILNNDIAELDLDEQKHILSIINEESNRLGRLINDLLDLQKIDSGKMVWKDEEINLAEVLQASANLFSRAFSDKGLELRLEPAIQECLILADMDRIKQVIANLLSNALKFTEQGHIAMTLAVESDHATVSVSDTGLGIPEQDLANIFESFSQVDSSETRKIGGSGLGLTICKEIVSHYHGRIWVESSLSKGSRFTFTLPLINHSKTGFQEDL